MNENKRRPRLIEFDYKGQYLYSITICVHDWRRIFEKGENYRLVFSVLRECADKNEFDIHAYCFMPDHAHFLVQGKDDRSDLRRFIKGFKQKSGFEFSKHHQEKLWQPSYYDHVLRKEEDFKAVALYRACRGIRFVIARRPKADVAIS